MHTKYVYINQIKKQIHLRITKEVFDVFVYLINHQL